MGYATGPASTGYRQQNDPKARRVVGLLADAVSVSADGVTGLGRVCTRNEVFGMVGIREVACVLTAGEPPSSDIVPDSHALSAAVLAVAA